MYVEQGIYELDLDNLPALKILPRAISNKSAEVEVFIKPDNVFVFARDIAGNVNYVAQEKNRRIKMYNNNPTNKISIVSGVNPDDELSDIITGEIYNLRTDDNIDKLLGDLERDLGTVNGELNIVKEDTSPTKNGVWEDFDLSTLTEDGNAVENKERDEEHLKTDISEELGGHFTSNVDNNQYCRFATTADLIKVFNLYKKVRITVLESEIIVENVEDYVKIKFPRTKSYTELDKIEELIKDLEWEDFPTEKVKSVIPAIEKIEPLKYKQAISILGDKLYTFSDTVAVETTSNQLSRNYYLNSEVLRILRYSTGKSTDVKISLTENHGVALNVDNLIVIFGKMEQPASNLFDLTRGTLEKEPFIEEIDKDFIRKLNTINSLFKNYPNVNIRTQDNLVLISNERMETLFTPVKRVSNGKQIQIDLEKLLLAISLTGSSTPTIDLFKINKNKVVILLEGVVRVLIDANEYKEE